MRRIRLARLILFFVRRKIVMLAVAWISSILLITQFDACHQAGTSDCVYGMGQHLKLYDGDFEQAPTTEALRDYSSICTPDSITLPVNRMIKTADGHLLICFADSSLHPSQYAQMLREREGYREIELRDTAVGQETWTLLRFTKDKFSVSDVWKPAKAKGMTEVFCYMCTDSKSAQSHFRNAHELALRLGY